MEMVVLVLRIIEITLFCLFISLALAYIIKDVIFNIAERLAEKYYKKSAFWDKVDTYLLFQNYNKWD